MNTGIYLRLATRHFLRLQALSVNNCTNAHAADITFSGQTATSGRKNHGILLVLLSLLLMPVEAFEQAPLRPFPQHVNYTAGSIKPSNFNQQQLDNAVKAFYDQWKAVYLKDDCGANQYYVWFDEESANNTICVSEGQGYGMMIAVFMAGYDPNAKAYFDGLYNFYKAHPSVNNNYLMAWNQITGCIDDPEGGNNSATDGDLDIAFALLLADKQWGSTGNINYLTEAFYIIDAIKQNEVNQGLWIPILGDWVLPGSDEYDDTRPSDFMMDHFRAFQNASGNSAWNNAVNNCYTLVNLIQTNYSPITGLLPDFIVNVSSLPEPAAPDYLEGEFDGDYYYNACRTPFRIASDYLVSADIRGKNAVQKINDWIRDQTGNDPSDIHAGYFLNGNAVPGSDYESAAFSGPIAVAAMVDASNQSWLNDTYDFLLSLELQDYEYYDNTLKLLCLLVLSGNYWVPQGVQGIGEDTFAEHINVTAYPNPFISSITVSIHDLNGSLVILSVEDIFGRTIYYAEEKNAAVEFLKTFDFSMLSMGIYFLRINAGDEQTIIKLLKH